MLPNAPDLPSYLGVRSEHENGRRIRAVLQGRALGRPTNGGARECRGRRPSAIHESMAVGICPAQCGPIEAQHEVNGWKVGQAAAHT